MKLIDIRKARTTCQVCGTHSKTTQERSVPNDGYRGGCGDSFCWHSCDMDVCKTRFFTVLACNVCAKKLEKPASAQRQSQAGKVKP